MSSIIKNSREKLGYTQIDLSKKSGLSLRTIQRLEASNKEPKGHSLQVISKVLEKTPVELKEKFHAVSQDKETDILSIKIINLSVLAFLGIPFGNIILPVLMWRRKRRSKLVDEVGRKIINFQIIWSVVLCFSMIIAPFVDNYIYTPMSLILMVLFIMLAINIVVVMVTAMSLQRKKLNFLNLHIRLI